MEKILIIEDDKTIANELEDTFTFLNFEVSLATNAKEGYQKIQTEAPDLIILDIMLPDHDGYEVCRKIRGQDSNIPIIMLTAKSQESDKLLGFELGADDYVTKPFSVKELAARVKAVLKRRESSQAPVIETINIGEIQFNPVNFELNINGEIHPLSPKECEILKLFIQNPNQVINRDRIIDEIWGDEYFPSPRTIDNFILKLRGKLEKDPKQPKHIETVHGAGYRFKP